MYWILLIGFSCLIILTSIYRLGRLRINYTAGTRQSQDSNPGLSDTYIYFFHYVFCFLSHTLALYIKYISKQVYERKNMNVKIHGVDGSLNVERRPIFQGKKVVGGSAQL